jgi:hypothetical protein
MNTIRRLLLSLAITSDRTLVGGWMRTRIEAALLVGAGPTTVFVRDGKVIAAANRTKDRERRGWNMDVRLKATRANLMWSVQDDEPADPRDVLLALLRDRDELK